MDYSENDICRLTGLCPTILVTWQAHGLITLKSVMQISDCDLENIRVIKALTSSGDTLVEIHTLLTDSWHYTPSGWGVRRAEFNDLIVQGNTQQLTDYLRKLISSYALADLTAQLFSHLMQSSASLNINARQRQRVLSIITSLLICSNSSYRQVWQTNSTSSDDCCLPCYRDHSSRRWAL